MRPVSDVGEAVAEPEVAVRDRHTALLRDARPERGGDLVDRRQLAGLRVLPLRRPALHLALDVALALREVAESDRVDVDRVQVGQHVDEVLGGGPAQLDGQLGGLLGTVEHLALDEAHHVERRAVDGLVGAQPERRGHGHAGAADRGDHAVLAGHVVGGGEHVAERRPTQHEAGAVGAGDHEREVRASARDQVEPERCDGTVDVLDEPPGDRLTVDAARRVGRGVRIGGFGGTGGHGGPP
jgi:hypothetical protein